MEGPPLHSDTNASAPPHEADRRRYEIVGALVAMERWIRGASRTGAITDDAEVNGFLAADPFAFLIGVLSDYGVPAERAWRVPFELHRRLGHLDPHLLAMDEASTLAAFQRRPVPHRFPRALAAFVTDAARRVISAYSGDARLIWSDGARAEVVQSRFEEFKGIKQKKAAMAVGILIRNLGVHFEATEGNDIAFDVHVRRVFLRSGLAKHDEPRAILLAARELRPSHPGGLDFAAWYIGRNWCAPSKPLCDTCPIGDACLREIAAAQSVRSI